MISCLCVGAGGFLGAVLRYLLSGIPTGSSGFPFMTLLINFAGALAIGMIAAAAEKTGMPGGNGILFLKVGVCGGFTTFSTYALELNQLFGGGKWGLGMVYAAGSVVLCLAAVWLGQTLVRIAL